MYSLFITTIYYGRNFIMNRQKQTSDFTAGYACIQSFYWMSFSAVMGFTSLYLLDVGFTNTEIGIIIAIAGIISAILQPIFAGYADKPKSPSLKKIILFLASLLLILSLALFLLYRRSVFFNGLFYGGCITLLQLLQPLINSLGMEVVNQGKKLNFGISRGIGSIAYAVAAYFLGLIVAKSGAGAIPISMIVTFAAVFFFTLRFSFQKGTHTESSANHEKTGHPFIFFKKYPRFAVTLIGCWLIYVSHILLNSFTFQIVENIGGGSSEMGFSMALAAILELPTMFLFSKMLKKVRCDIWFRISGIFFMLKILGTLLASSISVFYAVQIFQMFGWALITVSSVYYVNAIMKKEDAIKGQAYITMTYTFGSVLGSLIGGALIDDFGVKTMLAFGTASAFVGMIIVFFSAQKTKEI